MNRHTQRDLLILLGLYLLAKEDGSPPDASIFQRANSALNNAGARLYEWLNPNDRYPRADHRGLNASDMPKQRAARLSPELILTLTRMVGFPDPKLAAAIAMAESSGRPDAVNSTSRERSIGLWQINTKAHPSYSVSELLDPMQNALAAFQISKAGTDWRPWTTFTKNKYQKHMTGVLA